MLRAADISVSFGAVRAVVDLTVEIPRGQVVGLIGPNGSGKSTFMNALTGVVAASGQITVDDSPLPMGNPYRIRRGGVARTFQTPQVYGALSCLENVLIGLPDRSTSGLVGAWLRRRRTWTREREAWTCALEALDEVGLVDLAETAAAGLSYGQRRLLELARTISGRPPYVLLDEPAAGLNDAETEHLAEILLGLRGRDTGLLVAEHKIPFIDTVCDRLVVVSQGQAIAEGVPSDMWDDEQVQCAYLGVS